MSIPGCLPAYGLDAESIGEGPACHAAGEFCFLCQFEASEDPDAHDLYTSIVDLVNHLSAQHRELPAIVRTVSNTYNATIRDCISYKHPETGQLVEKPDWSCSSIRRHLLFTDNRFPQLFDSVVQHILRSLIVAHNRNLICEETGEPFEDKRRALMCTLNSLARWENHTGIRMSSEAPPKRRRTTKKNTI